MARPTDDEVQEQIDLASEAAVTGQSQWPGMTYEQGVDNALRWALGETDDAPMEEE